MTYGRHEFAFHLLDFAPLADVADHREKKCCIHEINRTDGNFERKAGSVASTPYEFLNLPGICFPVRGEAAKKGFDLATVGRNLEQRPDVAAQERRLCDAEHGRRRGIQAFDAATRVENDHSVFRAVENRLLPGCKVLRAAICLVSRCLTARDQHR